MKKTGAVFVVLLVVLLWCGAAGPGASGSVVSDAIRGALQGMKGMLCRYWPWFAFGIGLPVLASGYKWWRRATRAKGKF